MSLLQLLLLLLVVVGPFSVCDGSSAPATDSAAAVEITAKSQQNSIKSAATSLASIVFQPLGGNLNCTYTTFLPTGYRFRPGVYSSCYGSPSSCAPYLQCDSPDYIPSPALMLACLANGATFTFSGCVRNPCYFPSMIPQGYKVTNSQACVDRATADTVTKCSAYVHCDLGYTEATPVALTCPTNSWYFTNFSGCVESGQCSLLPSSSATLPTGYQLSTSLPSQGCYGLPSACTSYVTCVAPDYAAYYPVKLQCPVNGSTFMFTGCTKNVCVFPSVLPLGYTVDATTYCAITAFAETVTYCQPSVHCASPAVSSSSSPISISCPTDSIYFTNFTGCNPPTCYFPVASAMPAGYQVSQSCVGTASQCAPYVSCANSNFDLSGSIQLTCLSNGGVFTFSGCESDTCVFPPNLPAGYALTTTPSTTDLNCLILPYTNTPQYCIRYLTCRPGYTTPVTTSGLSMACTYPYFGSFSGCSLANISVGAGPMCYLPNSLPSGYSNKASSGLGCYGTALGCVNSLTCSTNYGGQPTLTCPSQGSTFQLTGCVAHQCSSLTVPVGYAATSSCVGTVAWCSMFVSCGSGFTGVPQLSCRSSLLTFEFSGCLLSPTAILPGDSTDSGESVFSRGIAVVSILASVVSVIILLVILICVLRRLSLGCFRRLHNAAHLPRNATAPRSTAAAAAAAGGAVEMREQTQPQQPPVSAVTDVVIIMGETAPTSGSSSSGQGQVLKATVLSSSGNGEVGEVGGEGEQNIFFESVDDGGKVTPGGTGGGGGFPGCGGGLCVVCMERPLGIAFIPCGHFCACEECATKLDRCPLCRSIPTSKAKVYLQFNNLR